MAKKKAARAAEAETFLDGKVRLLKGDCFEVLKTLPDNSVDSVVCDPPYGLQFMGKQWDKLWRNRSEADAAYVERLKKGNAMEALAGRMRNMPNYSAADPVQMQIWHEQWARECLRVLKPGGHLLAFSGTRTYHRMATAIEDAGFEIRDQIGWLYGSGFPKSLNISKAIDKAKGLAEKRGYVPTTGGLHGGTGETVGKFTGQQLSDKPVSKEAKQWNGWGTAIKPCWEPIVMARKPFSERTAAANIVKWGVGGLNVDACRVGASGGAGRVKQQGEDLRSQGGWGYKKAEFDDTVRGRFPGNVIHDGSDEVLNAFPKSKSVQTKAPKVRQSKNPQSNAYGKYDLEIFTPDNTYEDEGSVARFFYEAKADPTRERLSSKHPTLKPVDLMQYLVRMVTPKGGTVLDPFAGTGSTGEAAWREGCECILIEREAEYHQDIAERMQAAPLKKTCPNASMRRSSRERNLFEVGGAE